MVTGFCFVSDLVTDISPVRALVGLRHLNFDGSGGSDRTANLPPVKDVTVKNLVIWNSSVCDISPLEGMPLVELSCRYSHVSDLSSLQKCKSLKKLHVNDTKVAPDSVAALQKVLPNCKIEWDDPAKLKTPEPAASGTK